MEFKKSKLSAKKHIFNILKKCGTHMRANGILQWDETYPNMDLVIQDISSGNMFSIYEEDQLIGAIVMDEIQSPQYKSVKWKYESSPVLVVHRLAINPELHGKGFGRRSMEFAEQHAKENGYQSIRLDAFKHNKPLQDFYSNLGYEECGEIPLEYTAGPFVCFEKAIT